MGKDANPFLRSLRSFAAMLDFTDSTGPLLPGIFPGPLRTCSPVELSATKRFQKMTILPNVYSISRRVLTQSF